MYPLGTPWATRLRTIAAAMAEGTEAVVAGAVRGDPPIQASSSIAAIGFVGLLVILFLMVFKPTSGSAGPEASGRRGRGVGLCGR